MKYISIIHEEDNFQLKSENKVIDINITTNHPELVFEDDSMIIFESTTAYYELISDANVYNMHNQELDLEYLLSEYVKDVDIVKDFSYKNLDINSVCSIDYNGNNIYYIQRSGK